MKIYSFNNSEKSLTEKMRNLFVVLEEGQTFEGEFFFIDVKEGFDAREYYIKRTIVSKENTEADINTMVYDQTSGIVENFLFSIFDTLIKAYKQETEKLDMHNPAFNVTMGSGDTITKMEVIINPPICQQDINAVVA